MDTKLSRKPKFKKMFINFLSTFVILAISFPATGSAAAQEPTPFLVAFPEWESIEGYGYPLGVNVFLEIDDPSTEDTLPDYFADGTVVETGWGGNYVKFNLWGEDGYDLKTGDLVSLIYNDERLTHTVRNLSVTNVDVETDSVMGMAEPREEVFVNTYDDWGMVVTTITLSSGEWIVDTGLNLEYNSGGRAQIYDDLRNSTAVDWSTPPPPPSPWLRAFPDQDLVDGSFWPADQQISLEIAGLQFDTTADSEGHVEFDLADYDLKRGDTLTMSSGSISLEYTVRQLFVENLDLDTETVSGVVDGQQTVHVWTGGAELYVETDPQGYWSADLSSFGDVLFLGACGNAEAWGDAASSSSTIIDWCAPPPPPIPWLIAFPENDAVEGLDWPVGEPVTLTIDNAPGFTWEGTPEARPWGDTHFRIEFGNDYDLMVGDVVTLTGEFGTSTAHEVQPLSIAGVDMDTNMVSGTANVGAQLQVWAHDQSAPPVDITADENGNWLANLTGVYDIMPDTAGRSQLYLDGNATAVDWNAPPPPPNPFIAVSLTQEWFMGDYWPPETLVTISVFEFQGASTPVLELSRYTDPSGHLSIEGWEHNWDLEPGNVVIAKDGSITKELSLEYITLDEFDPESDLIAGTGLGGRKVDVGVGNGDGEQWLTVYADEVSGVWTADFTTVGFNITEDMWAGAHVNDEDGDVTAAHNSGRSLPPNPRIVASITENWFYLLDFAPGALVNLSIYESQGGGQVWAGTATTDGSGFAWVNAVEHGWDLEPGTYLLVSDGNSTKELVIEEFTFELMDVTRGLLKGTASEPFGRQVWVGIGWENDRWSVDVTTSKKGAWKADFGAPVPNGYDWVAAQIFDADGDASELRPARTIGRTVTVGNFYVEWSTTNPEEVVDLRWNDSVNLTNTWTHPACSGDLEFFGNSWVSENEGEDSFFFASLVGWGTTGTWKEQTHTNVRIGSKSSSCPGSADIPIKTDYRFFNEDLRANLIVVKRMFKFGDVPYAHDVRPFIPRLYPSDGFTEVLHPDANGTTLVAEGTCDFGCPAASWDGSWFAIHNPATGVGMIVQRKPSSYAAALWLDDDDGSLTNSSSILLLQPVGGFTGTVTETEYLCFYDSSIWSPSLTLPAGCQP